MIPKLSNVKRSTNQEQEPYPLLKYNLRVIQQDMKLILPNHLWQLGFNSPWDRDVRRKIFCDVLHGRKGGLVLNEYKEARQAHQGVMR